MVLVQSNGSFRQRVWTEAALPAVQPLLFSVSVLAFVPGSRGIGGIGVIASGAGYPAQHGRG